MSHHYKRCQSVGYCTTAKAECYHIGKTFKHFAKPFHLIAKTFPQPPKTLRLPAKPFNPSAYLFPQHAKPFSPLAKPFNLLAYLFPQHAKPFSPHAYSLRQHAKTLRFSPN